MSQNAFSIQVEDVTKKFKTLTALNNLSLNFSAGMMHGVIGPEGAGKTTLMRVILGLLKPNNGIVRFAENDCLIEFEKVRSEIAYMPQQQSLYADLSIQEHLDFFKALYGISEDFYTKKRLELLEMTRLTKFLDHPAGKLSGGMYKKLGLMCTLLKSPSIILLDEPTNGVDPISRREFWELLYHLVDQNILIIITTAYMDEAERCGYVHFLDKGKLIVSGEPRELLQRSKVKNFDELFVEQKSDE